MVSWTKKRLEMLRKIVATIKKAALQDKEVSKLKLIAEMGYVHGTAKRTALEYIENLVDAGEIYEEIVEDQDAIKKLELPKTELEARERQKNLPMITILKPILQEEHNSEPVDRILKAADE